MRQTDFYCTPQPRAPVDGVRRSGARRFLEQTIILSDAALRVGLHRCQDTVYCLAPRKLSDAVARDGFKHMDRRDGAASDTTRTITYCATFKPHTATVVLQLMVPPATQQESTHTTRLAFCYTSAHHGSCVCAALHPALRVSRSVSRPYAWCKLSFLRATQGVSRNHGFACWR